MKIMLAQLQRIHRRVWAIACAVLLLFVPTACTTTGPQPILPKPIEQEVPQQLDLQPAQEQSQTEEETSSPEETSADTIQSLLEEIAKQPIPDDWAEAKQTEANTPETADSSVPSEVVVDEAESSPVNAAKEELEVTPASKVEAETSPQTATKSENVTKAEVETANAETDTNAEANVLDTASEVSEASTEKTVEDRPSFSTQAENSEPSMLEDVMTPPIEMADSKSTQSATDSMESETDIQQKANAAINVMQEVPTKL